MSFAEFKELPDEICRNSELRHGALVRLAYPKQIDVWVQQRLVRLLDLRAERYGVVGMEIPLRRLPNMNTTMLTSHSFRLRDGFLIALIISAPNRHLHARCITTPSRPIDTAALFDGGALSVDEIFRGLS